MVRFRPNLKTLVRSRTNAYLEYVTALVVLQSPPVAFKYLYDIVLTEDREQSVQENFQPDGNGMGAIQNQRGHVKDYAWGHGLHAKTVGYCRGRCRRRMPS